VLQIDAYAAYGKLADPKRVGGPVRLAYCWAHWRRQWFDIARSPPAPIAAEVLQRIAQLYQIEAEIRGKEAEQRRAARQHKSKPLIDALKNWLEQILLQIPSGASIATPFATAAINGRGCCASSTTAASRSTPIPSSAQ
jgi:transposase